jgi:hypothetical protein
VPSRVEDAVDPAAWMAGFEELFAEVVAPFFYRREPRLRSRWYLLGLVSGLERKNGWTLAEFAGEATPDGMQRLLNAAVWDADRVRDACAAMWPAAWGAGMVCWSSTTLGSRSRACVRRGCTGSSPSARHLQPASPSTPTIMNAGHAGDDDTNSAPAAAITGEDTSNIAKCGCPTKKPPSSARTGFPARGGGRGRV